MAVDRGESGYDRAMVSDTLPRLVVHVAFFSALGAVAWFDRQGVKTPDSESTPVHFREVAREVGIQHRHRKFVPDAKIKNIEQHVAGVGAAVTLVDFDRDGNLDVFTTSSQTGSTNALFRNLGNGRFEDVSAASGLADLNAPGTGFTMGAIFADLDGDADPDAFVYRFGKQRLMRNDGGRFVDVSPTSGLEVWMNSPNASFLDFDRDGDLDLYVAAYFRSDIDLGALTSTKIMQNSFEFATNGGKNRLFRNDGELKFTDVTDETGVGSERWTLATAALDVNGDGYVDLYLANDYGPEELFLNREGKRFELAKDVGLSDRSKSGMCVAVGDVKNEGRPSLFVTNICRAGYLFQGNNLRWNRLPESGRFENLAEHRQVIDAGWAWGSQFGDLDNDGWQDLFVVNGFISQSQERDYWFAMGKIASGMEGFFADATNWPAIDDRSLSGYEISRVLMNRGGQDFRDFAVKAGVTDEYDGRGIALGDLWNRGQLDVVIANQAGPLLVYRNESAADHHYIQFQLRGRGSNTDAIGACVRILRTDGLSSCQFVLAGSGFAAQNSPRLHFGLGDVEDVASVEIRWPSGKQQHIDHPKVDMLHTIEEPAL